MMRERGDFAPAWPTKRLGDVIELKYGRGLTVRARDGVGYPVYGSGGIVGLHSVPVTSGPSIIIGRKGSIGSIVLEQGPCSPIDTVYFVDDFGPFDPEFLAALLRFVRLDRMNRASAIPSLTREDAYDVRVPIPTITVQKRIVERIQHGLERVGELTRLHAERAEYVAKLVPATLDEVFSEFRDCDVLLEETLAFGPQNGLYLPKEQYVPDGVPMVHMGDMFRRFELTAVPDRRVRVDKEAAAKYRLHPDDVLVARRSLVFDGSGSMTQVGAIAEPMLFESSIIRVRPDTNRLLPGFLVAYFYSREGTKRRLSISRKATISGINQEGLARLKLPVPDVASQRRALQQISQIRMLHAKILTHDVSDRLEQLPMAILSKAFRGELCASS